MNGIYIIPTFNDDPEMYGFGSWLKNNAGNVFKTIGGAALLATGIGASAGVGMMASGVGGMVGNIGQSKEEENAEAQLLEQKKNALAQSRLSGLTSNTNVATFKKGGHLPEGNATLAEAKEYIKAFPEEMKMGEEVEYEHTGNQKLAQRIAADHVKDYLKMTGTPGYYSAMKEAGISDELNKMANGGFFEYKNGGIYIKPENKGKFTSWAKKHGMSVKEAARKVMANKENYSPTVVKRANFAKNFAHANGGVISSTGIGESPLDFLTEYKGGKTHEQNMFGGIPIGEKARVESGEYKFDDPDSGESYIFSNRF